MKAIVIGAGVIGSAVAYRLAEAGASVTIVEGNRVGGGTSGISFAWTNSNNKHPRPYHDLNANGMKAHAALRDEFGVTPWLHQSGSLEWCREAERSSQREKVERLKSWGYAIDYITKKELAELEPDIDLDSSAMHRSPSAPRRAGSTRWSMPTPWSRPPSSAAPRWRPARK